MKISIPILCLFLAIGLIACGGEKPKKVTKTPPKEVKKADPPATETVKTTETPAETTPAPKEEAPKVIPTPPEHLEKAKEIIAGVTDDAIGAVDAKKKYKQFCAACHGFKGDLKVNGAKDLTVSKISLVESVAQVYHGKGLMTPFKGILKDEEIVAVGKYIETLRK